ncbi:efflux RND transporter periplasmic adaptor subunit [Rhodovastum atsumiense]|uniref:Efflux RND transporter periplasmic adaptor subunit n=2 Tax=Rhodovastum atsumiense TaxID=504468 RepID=A0A5M6IWD6_9PROT|nr:efflux RND transporter periplasmic adaptor subunit [Rhodovastum atsumiense]
MQVTVRLVGATGLALLAVLPGGCKDRNHYVPPPPPKVTTMLPVQREVIQYLEVNGSVEAVNSVDLMARVTGFLQEINYADGAMVARGTSLFTIEPEPYRAKLLQAQAQVQASEAVLKHAQEEYLRQSTLGKDQFASQSKVDEAIRNRDQSSADLQNSRASLELAAIDYSYTHVLAPFDGIVTRHLASIGALVGGATPTRLASIIQLDPIYVTFNVSERDVLRIRQSMVERGIKVTDLSKVPVEVGLANETGYPHAGALNYVAPLVDPGTGTLTMRGVFANPEHTLLPGYFARVRIPTRRDAAGLLVPDTALGADQGGRYVLVVGADGVVAQRYVQTGALSDGLRVIETGLQPGDRVVVAGLQAAIPGSKVEAVPGTAATAR